MIYEKAFAPNLAVAFKHFWRQYHNGGNNFKIDKIQNHTLGDGVGIVFDGEHFDNHLHGSSTNDQDSGRLQLLLAITEEANRNGFTYNLSLS